jgi:2-(1,2-epoxy-1,2-dihydrophenyl)acetyl-CoA isomerase
MDQPVLIDRRESWLKLTLNRPDRLNAFNAAQHTALAAALDDAAKDPEIRAVLLTGAGRGFSAGQDLDATEEGGGLSVALEEFYNPLIRRIRTLRAPVVCAVNGVAAGAGANIALACDIVLAARSASFIQAFIRIGLVPDSGGTWFLPKLVGDARARGLAMLGDKLDAPRAEQWGLIWRCIDDDKLIEDAEALTAQLATQPTQALALIKQAINAAGGNTLDQQLDLERDLQAHAFETPDYREGVQAFLDKRKPVFTGHAK